MNASVVQRRPERGVDVGAQCRNTDATAAARWARWSPLAGPGGIGWAVPGLLVNMPASPMTSEAKLSMATSGTELRDAADSNDAIPGRPPPDASCPGASAAATAPSIVRPSATRINGPIFIAHSFRARSPDSLGKFRMRSGVAADTLFNARDLPSVSTLAAGVIARDRR
jgi:hypothetical protein